jgi:hypothetical protein
MSNSRTTPADFEKMARNAFNKSQGTKAEKSVVSIGKAHHEFDLYQEGIIVGGISTSPWVNRTAKQTNNSGGQDRVSTELLWLHLYKYTGRKVLILREKDMADGIYSRFGGSGFFNPAVEIWLFDPITNTITHHSDL